LIKPGRYELKRMCAAFNKKHGDGAFAKSYGPDADPSLAEARMEFCAGWLEGYELGLHWMHIRLGIPRRADPGT
jgi:hypothetical protein